MGGTRQGPALPGGLHPVHRASRRAAVLVWARRTLTSRSLGNCARNMCTARWGTVTTSGQSQRPCQPLHLLSPPHPPCLALSLLIFVTHSLGFLVLAAVVPLPALAFPPPVKSMPSWKTLTSKEQQTFTSGLPLTSSCRKRGSPSFL